MFKKIKASTVTYRIREKQVSFPESELLLYSIEERPDFPALDCAEKLGNIIATADQLENYDISISPSEYKILKEDGLYFIKPSIQSIKAFEKGKSRFGEKAAYRIFDVHGQFRYETSEFVLQSRPGNEIETFQYELESLGLRFAYELKFAPNLYVFNVVGNACPFGLSHQLGNDNRFVFAEPNFGYKPIAAYSFTDSYYQRQWHLNNEVLDPTGNPNGQIPRKPDIDVNAEDAWDDASINGGAGVKIAVVEDGFDLTHPDLASAVNPLRPGVTISKNGGFEQNNVKPDPDKDNFDHGTAVAGVALARKDIGINAAGSQGMAFNAEFIPVSTGKHDGLTTSRAIAYAADPAMEIDGALASNGADIINISFTHRDDTLQQLAVDFAAVFGRQGKGCVVVVSGFNEMESNADIVLPPIEQSIAMGNIAPDGSYFGSGFGPTLNEIDFVAPGIDIFTCTTTLDKNDDPLTDGLEVPLLNSVDSDWALPGSQVGFVTNIDGTSFSAPLVSGIAALVLEAQPKLTWREVKEILRKSCRPVNVGWNGHLPTPDNADKPYEVANLGWIDSGNNSLVKPSGVVDLDHPEYVTDELLNAITASNDRTVTLTLKTGNNAKFHPGAAVVIGGQTELLEDIVASTTPTTLKVAKKHGFKTSDTIRIGVGQIAYIYRDTSDPDNKIKSNEISITCPAGYKVGDKIKLTNVGHSESRTITEINRAELKIGKFNRLNNILKLDSNRTNDYGRGDRVEIDPSVIEDRTITLIDDSDANFDIITVNTAFTLDHAAGTKVELPNTEVRTVLGVVGTNQVIIDAIFNSHNADTPVSTGRVADFAPAYGKGLVDAHKAVLLAKGFDFHVSNPDLIIRDYKNSGGYDDGLTITTQPLDSPDIWVQTTDTPQTIPDSDWADLGSTLIVHDQPLIFENNFIYVRLKNIGGAPCHFAKVQVYLALSEPSDTLDFPRSISDPALDWTVEIKSVIQKENKNVVSKGIKNGEKGVYFLGEKEITDKSIPAGKDNVEDGISIVGPIVWDAFLIPFPSSTLEAHIIAIVTPFDGQFNDPSVVQNNNFAIKEVTPFLQVSFEQNPSGLFLPEEILINNTNPPTSNPFKFVIKEMNVNFDTEKTVIEIQRKNKGGPKDKLKFSYDGTDWKFEDGATPDWINIDDPTVITPGDQHAEFEGNFDSNNTQKKIKITISVFDSSGLRLFKRVHVIRFKVELDNELGFSDNRGARYHFFTNTQNLVDQTPANMALTDGTAGEFGPVPSSLATEDAYRVTSLHKSTATATAFAICDGTICAQESDVPGAVNLILKPLKQPPFTFIPIKYIIYKGVKTISLFNGAEIASEDTNQLTKTIWETQHQTNQSINDKETALGQPLSPPQNPPKEALGIHLTSTLDPAKYADTAPIRNLFFREDTNFQFPIVRGGWNIGEFDNSLFGIEIVLDDPAYKAPLSAARVLEHVITVDAESTLTTPAEFFENKADREEVLSYIDPSAFFGSFYSQKLFAHESAAPANTLVDTTDANKKKRNNIADDVLITFNNRNKTYLDIRNEFNHSVNFYDNYNNNIELSLSSNSLTDIDYYRSGWPILVVENGEFEPGNNKNKDVLQIGFPVAKDISIDPNAILENPLPLAHVAQGFPNRILFPFRPVKGKRKFADIAVGQGPTFTVIEDGFSGDTLELAVPNNDDGSGTNIISTYNRINYVKRFEENPEDPIENDGKILRSKYAFDNLFCPLDLSIPFVSGTTPANQSVVAETERYVDATFSDQVEMDFAGKLGVAEDATNITFFAFATDVREKAKNNRNKPFSIIGRKGKDSDAINDLTANVHDNVGLHIKDLVISGTPTSYLEADDTSGSFFSFNKVDPTEFQAIMLSKTEYNNILSLAQDPLNFNSTKFPVYLGVELVSGDTSPHNIDDNAVEYTRYELVLRGHLQVGADYEVNTVNTNVIIYTNGNI